MAPTAAPTPTPGPPQPPPSAGLADGFEGYANGERWADGSEHGPWRTVFTGYGEAGVQTDGSHTLTLVPQSSSATSETHAGLVVSKKSFADSVYSVRVKTVRHLRSGEPNPWETAWVLWHYTDNRHFYYLVLKPNGWELGKEDPAYPGAQRFLATGTERTFPIGAWYDVRVRSIGATTTVWVDGAELTSFTDGERPYAGGAVGMYTEDAEVRFDDATVEVP